VPDDPLDDLPAHPPAPDPDVADASAVKFVESVSAAHLAARAPKPAPKWGAAEFAPSFAVPGARRLLLVMLVLVVAMVAATFFFLDRRDGAARDDQYRALAAYAAALAATGPDLDLGEDLQRSLSVAVRTTASNGDVRLSLAGPAGCWSVLLPAVLFTDAPRPMPAATPVAVDAALCR
jgi:hypothetical protein